MLPPGGSETELVISKTGPRPRRGERILHKMQLGDDAPAIAKRLTMEDLPDAAERWSRFLRQAAKVDLMTKRTIDHEDTQTVHG
jgi:hypothetical protein